MGEANFLFPISHCISSELTAITLMNSNFACSLSVSMVLVTLNIVLIISWHEYPKSQSSFNDAKASSMRCSWHALIMACTLMGCGLSTTLKTLSPFTKPKPANVDCRLLIACRISPSAEKTSAAIPSSEYFTSSASQICITRRTTCASVRRAYLSMAHLDCSGSMILFDWLQANANRVVAL